MFFENTILLIMLYNSSQELAYFKLPNGMNRTYDLVLWDKQYIATLKNEVHRALGNFTQFPPKTTTPLPIIIYKNKFTLMNIILKISMTILFLAILSFVIYFIYHRHYFIKKKPNNSNRDDDHILAHMETDMEMVRENEGRTIVDPN